MSVFTPEQEARLREIVRETVADLAPILAAEVASWIAKAQRRHQGRPR